MKLEVLADAEAVARRAAALIASEARGAVAARGRFVMAVSGGRTPWAMLRALALEEVPWSEVHVLQVDERIAPTGHPDRNLTHLHESLLSRTPLPAAQLYAMPVESGDPAAAVADYSKTLEKLAGSPPVLDLAHLGLGEDGHTGSLIPNDPVLAVTDCNVAVTGVYKGWRRMTLTLPVLDRARRVLWLVAGADKAVMLGRLLSHDPAIPAGRVRPDNALVLADCAAAGEAGSTGQGKFE